MCLPATRQGATHLVFCLVHQDWLDDTTTWISYLTKNATLGRQWLMQMGKGADKSGIAIQYCMSFSRHVMQSIEIPAVVRVRDH